MTHTITSQNASPAGCECGTPFPHRVSFVRPHAAIAFGLGDLFLLRCRCGRTYPLPAKQPDPTADSLVEVEGAAVVRVDGNAPPPEFVAKLSELATAVVTHERTAIVRWLRSQPPAHSRLLGSLADNIERGAHVKS